MDIKAIKEADISQQQSAAEVSTARCEDGTQSFFTGVLMSLLVYVFLLVTGRLSLNTRKGNMPLIICRQRQMAAFQFIADLHWQNKTTFFNVFSHDSCLIHAKGADKASNLTKMNNL